MVKVDVVINGGGMVGLALAQRLAEHNFTVALVEASDVPFPDAFSDLTARVSAMNQSSIRLLQTTGIWPSIKNKAELQRLVVWDDLGGGEVSFDAGEAGLRELGFIVENREIVRSLWHQLQARENLIFFTGQKPQALHTDQQAVQLELASGEKIQAALCVGADGANSWLRHQMQTAMKMRPYQHQAIIAVIETEKPHENTGWQNFLTTGPLALLPLSDPHQCAIVWSSVNERARELMAMDALEFECELNNAFGARLGMLRYLADRRAFPLVMRHAERYIEERLVLVGDAAHTIHPLAGQGLNLGFSDVIALVMALQAATEKRQDIGSLRVLRRYERSRKGDNTEMILAMRGFYELFSSANTATVQLRSQGLKLIDRCRWFKKFFMRVALG